MVYPSLIIIFFDLFNCYKIEQGELWLINDLQLRCWHYDHLFWAFMIGIPGILFWVIGIPFIAFKALRSHRHSLADPMTLGRFKMMYQGLKSDFYYWEFVTLIRKLLLISIGVFLSSVDSYYKVSFACPYLLSSAYLRSLSLYCFTLLQELCFHTRSEYSLTSNKKKWWHRYAFLSSKRIDHNALFWLTFP